MKNDDDMKDDMSGTTAVAIIVKNGIAYCGKRWSKGLIELSSSYIQLLDEG